MIWRRVLSYGFGSTQVLLQRPLRSSSPHHHARHHGRRTSSRAPGRAQQPCRPPPPARARTPCCLHSKPKAARRSLSGPGQQQRQPVQILREPERLAAPENKCCPTTDSLAGTCRSARVLGIGVESDGWTAPDRAGGLTCVSICPGCRVAPGVTSSRPSKGLDKAFLEVAAERGDRADAQQQRVPVRRRRAALQATRWRWHGSVGVVQGDAPASVSTRLRPRCSNSA